MVHLGLDSRGAANAGVWAITMFTRAEEIAAEEFMSAHYKKHKKTAEVSLTVRATGISNSVKIRCPYCRKEKDITDYASW